MSFFVDKKHQWIFFYPQKCLNLGYMYYTCTCKLCMYANLSWPATCAWPDDPASVLAPEGETIITWAAYHLSAFSKAGLSNRSLNVLFLSHAYDFSSAVAISVPSDSGSGESPISNIYIIMWSDVYNYHWMVI